MKDNEFDKMSLKELKEKADETMVTLDGILKNNLLALDEYLPEDFEVLLEEMGENYQDIEMLNFNIAMIKDYMFCVKEEQQRLIFKKDMKESDISNIVFNNLNTIVASHTTLFSFLMVTSRNLSEFLFKMLVTIFISRKSYELVKSYFLSNRYKEKVALELSLIKELLQKYELNLMMHEKTKEYYEKETYFQRLKLKEIAPKRRDNETEEEFLERCLPKSLNIGDYEIEFKPTNVKTRKRER